MSWISRADTVRALLHLLERTELAGPVNLSAPEPETNAAFSRALAKQLGRPSLLAVPAFAARLALGELADAALLRGQRVMPRRLLESGFQFQHPALAPCLAALLGG
jgi:NAD dependent epimerase/dehydratase family enzyme